LKEKGEIEVKKINKIIFLLITLSLVFSNIALTTTVGSSTKSKFKDLSTSHWAYTAIVEAHNKGIVTGYKDGTFKPNQHVAEAEFLSILFKSYQEVKPVEGKPWHSPIYDLALELNYPVDLTPKAILNRLRVAEIMTGVAGFHYTGDHAIQFMLGNGYANGKVSGTISIENYKGEDKLTRAEAVVFIANAKAKGINKLNKRPETQSDKKNLPSLNLAQEQKSLALLKEIETKVREAGFDFERSTLRTDGTIGWIMVTKDGKDYVHYSQKNSLVLDDYRDKDAMNLWADLALLLGAKGVTKKDILDGTQSFIDTGRAKFFRIDNDIVASIGGTGDKYAVVISWD